jgi:membrane-bound lytic murein transglycosylase MltF
MTSGIIVFRGFLFGVLIYVFALVFATIRMANAQDYAARLDKCEPYRTEVERILDEERVARDYFYLMVAESGCRQNAVSHKGARGFWQLMPSTATRYGCRDLYSIECATRAAARYIRHLQTSFKSFDDIIAAYNMGGHNLRRHGRTREAMGLVITVHRLIRLGNDNI